MEIIVQGRNAEISDRFREHVADKLAKVEQFAPRAQRVEVEVTHEAHLAQTDVTEKIEITVVDKGPVIRAEASASDRGAALDLATTKLIERLRRVRDRKKDHRRGSNGQEPSELNIDLKELNADLVAEQPREETVPTEPGQAVEQQLGDSPVIVRQKLHEASPMSVDQALYEMELVGHPFFLFIDEDTKQPCVVYHRHGWTYGVIRLDTTVTD
ncbi:ribosome hibernation-promoting factor, HPF/YfiA family [Flaviflexus equikiangi]|uniref:Ribosome hibernation promoting factor n=1 Tax=Flaviflexus equikiangi TaxID=2758573 RepID=A0ABS2TGR4_9ACTO|nr:ribosome-associated translation inhibitor RaiA [Flaviflexus equikiangi]MBM9433836.1 ribosome-associated translation inhibitor RaiA [Flaviflexus equikiangi]